jgi:hypothetical protein
MLYFKKSQPAPACLEIEKQKAIASFEKRKNKPVDNTKKAKKIKIGGKYDCGHTGNELEDSKNCVRERIKNDFKNKCYICEKKEFDNINIEHFKSHRNEDINLKFDWDNLFFACSYCNGIKNSKYPEFDNILNCTCEDDFKKDSLAYHCNSHFPKEKVDIKALIANNVILNTRDLLLNVFNGTTPQQIQGSYNLRKNLIKEYKKFIDDMFEYNNTEQYNKEYYKRKIISHLHKSSPFVSFKRQFIRLVLTKINN